MSAWWIVGGVAGVAVVGLVLGLELSGTGSSGPSDREQIIAQFDGFYADLERGDADSALDRMCITSERERTSLGRQLDEVAEAGGSAGFTVDDVGIDGEVAAIKYYDTSDDVEFSPAQRRESGWCLVPSSDQLTAARQEKYEALKVELGPTR